MKIIVKTIIAISMLLSLFNTTLLKDKAKKLLKSKTDEDSSIINKKAEVLTNNNSLIFRFFSKEDDLSTRLKKAYDSKADKGVINIIYLVRNKKGAYDENANHVLSDILKNCPNLKSFSLSYSHLEDNQAISLIKALTDHKILNSVSLLGNNISLSAAKEIIEMLSPTVKTLNLGKNSFDKKEFEELRKLFKAKDNERKL